MDDVSPPPFVVFRAPKKLTPYDQALALVALVHEILAVATSRFHLKDRLDRTSTTLVMALGKVEASTPSRAWREYRQAQDAAREARSVLDILAAQKAAAADLLTRARTIADELVVSLDPRTRG